MYGRGTSTVERLRAELSENGVDASRLDGQTLERVLERAGAGEEFVVKVSDLKAGRALEAGRTEPLPGHSGSEEPGGRNGSGRAR